MGWFENKLQRPMDKRAERRILGKPCAEKPLSRFDERGGDVNPRRSLLCLLFNTALLQMPLAVRRDGSPQL
jgi:hypothetical protein